MATTNGGEAVGAARMAAVAGLVGGNLLGAGILALPINTGLSGFLPSMAGMAVYGLAMFFSAVVLADEAMATKSEDFDYPSLYGRHLGRVGQWVAVATNLLILYGLLTAYLTGAGAVLASLVGAGTAAMSALFFVGATVLTLLGIGIIRKYNVLLMGMLLIAFGALLVMIAPHVEVERLTTTDWPFLLSASPIILTAFHFHNIIPTVCHDLGWSRRAVLIAMGGGMILGFLMNAAWILAGVGALPATGENSLIAAFQASQPATIPLAAVVGTKVFLTCALIFALVAITTSYVANGMGLLSFVRDIVTHQIGRGGKPLVVALTFGPPLLIAFAYPDIFLSALNVVGGVGIVILFGVLPSILWIRNKPGWRARALGIVCLVLFLGTLVFEVCQECGLLRIQPEAEYYEHNLEKHLDTKSE